MQPNPAPQKADARAWGTGGANEGDKTVFAEGRAVTELSNKRKRLLQDKNKSAILIGFQ